MKITNKYNLPDAMYNFVVESQFGKTPKHYSATTIINPVKYIILNNRHDDEIEQDVSDMINMLLGTATHSLIEKFDRTGMAEMYLKQEIADGYFLTGKCDLYDEVNSTLVDYKTATIYKIKFNDFEDWRKQGLIYAWLLEKKNKHVEYLKFHAILKDWSPREKRLNSDYPESQVYTWEYKVSAMDLMEIEVYIYNTFSQLIKAESQKDDEIALCNKKDCWYSGDKYAVYKKKADKRATRLFDTKEEAEAYKTENSCEYVEYREGEYRRCDDYCNARKWCNR